MPKEVTVLGLEGSVLRGIRLEESGKGFAVSASEAWDTAAPEEGVSGAQEGAEPQPESADAVEETAIDRLAGAFAAAVQTFGTHEFVLSLPLSRLLIETVRVPVENRDELAEATPHAASWYYNKGDAAIAKKDWRTAVDAVKGTHHHLKTKKQHKLEKAKFQLKKADNKLYKAKTGKPKLRANKAALRSAKAEYKAKKKPAHGNKLRKAMNKRRLQAYKQTKRELKFERKQLKTESKFRIREFRNQKKISKLTRPGLLALKPATYTAGRMKASAWQKAVNEDQDNDFLHAIDSAKRRVVEPAAQKVSKPQRLQKKEKQRDRLNDKKSKSNNRLNRQETRLKDKHDSYKKRKKPKPKKKKGAKDTISAALKAAWKFVKNVYESEVKKFFLCLAIPVIVILLVFIVILLVFGIITMLFSATSSHSGFTLGTYAAQDYDLSEAEKYYTELAYNLNQKIRKVGSSADWQSGLAAFGANTGDLSDTPDEWVWGRSSIYDFDPVYDFDTYKLWSFLCAYYYDFDADNDDIYYWEFDGDTEDLLEEIFNEEYEFVYWYDNQSRWEELSPYNYWGGGNASSGTYYRAYRAEKDAYIYDGQPYRYRFKPIAITSELSQYEDDEGYLCITDGYRVLDAQNDYKETGFFIMDHRWYSGTSEPFYYIDNATNTFFFMHGGERHDRSFWGWDGTDAWFLVSPTDTHIWNSGLNDVCMYAYYEKYKWKTECKLYYNVKQNKTFDVA